MAKTLIVSRAQLARLVGCTPDRITKYCAEGLPVVTTGGGRGRRTTFELAGAVQWLLGRRVSDAELARFRRIQADRAELEYQLKAGNLVSAKAVEAAWLDIILQVRTVMLGVASKVKQRHQNAPRELLAAVDEESRRGLEALANSAMERR